MMTSATAVSRRTRELQRAHEREQLAAKRADNAKRLAEFRAVAEAELRVTTDADRTAAGIAAERAARAARLFESAMICTSPLTGDAVRVDWRLDQREPGERAMLSRSVYAAQFRLSMWFELGCAVARLRGQGLTPDEPASAERVAVLMREDLANVIKLGWASVETILKKKTKGKK